MKVTLAPAQAGLADAAILTLTGRLELTVMVNVFEVAGFPVGQVAFEFKVQYTWFPVARVALVYVGLLEPTGLPFKYH